MQCNSEFIRKCLTLLMFSFQMTAKMSNELKLMRLLIRQMKDISQWKTVKDKRMVQYILNETHIYKETSQMLCKARKELKTLADNYSLYLSSQQKYQEIQKHFAGKGERCVQEIAASVGFKLPNNPK